MQNMSKTDITTIRVRLRNQNHPSGNRRRAGFLFTTDVSEVEVTPEQLELIQADEALYIMREHDAEDTQEPVITTDTTQDPVITGDQTGNSQGTGTTDDEPKQENLKRANKGRLIEILATELKQVPETDFDPEATNDALIALIESLRQVPGAAQ
jgi:hypothetical protein